METLATKFHRSPQPCSHMGQGGFGSGTGLAAWELHRCPRSRGALRGG